MESGNDTEYKIHEWVRIGNQSSRKDYTTVREFLLSINRTNFMASYPGSFLGYLSTRNVGILS